MNRFKSLKLFHFSRVSIKTKTCTHICKSFVEKNEAPDLYNELPLKTVPVVLYTD